MEKIKEIFISENERLLDKLIDEGVDFREKEKELKEISNKSYNNKVGYIQFRDKKGNLYKVYVLPKIIKKDEKDKSILKREFASYLNTALNLVGKHKGLNIIEFKHIESLANYLNKGQTSFDSFESVIYKKYEIVLEKMFEYFKRHNPYTIKEEAYFSQTLKHKLDLMKNIKEINKSRIHQKKKEKLIYSEIAYITYKVLNYFESEILINFEKEIKPKLQDKILRLKNLIKKKYKEYSTEKAKIKEILSNNVKKLFKTNKDRKIYSYLLTLLGLEMFVEDKKVDYISTNAITFFISPEKIYEVFVYDYLESIFKDVGFQQSKTYCLKLDNKEEITTESIPDIIIRTENKIFLIDTKWKILDEIKDISNEDMLKLERDCKVWSDNGKEIIPVLIYPKSEPKCAKIEAKYSEKESFTFYIQEFGFDFS